MDLKKYFDTKSIKGQIQKEISIRVANALKTFCSQEPEFEQAIEQSGKTFQECLDFAKTKFKKINGGVELSDLDAFMYSVKFYFSTATVHFNMTIDLSGDNGHIDPPITMTQSKPKSSLSASLDDLLDF